MLLLVPLLAFAGVFAGTLAYYELVNDEAPAAATRQAAARTEGTLIVALEQKPGVRLYVVSADGSGGRFVTGDNEPTDGSVLVEAHPDWSPTTERIVFTRYTVRVRMQPRRRSGASLRTGPTSFSSRTVTTPISWRPGHRTARGSSSPGSWTAPPRSSS